METLFYLCQSIRPLEPPTAAALLKFQFKGILRLWECPIFSRDILTPDKLRQNVRLQPCYALLNMLMLQLQLPTELRNKIARRSYNPGVYLCRPPMATMERPYILGYGKNKVVCWEHTDRAYYLLAPYPSMVDYLSRSSSQNVHS